MDCLDSQRYSGLFARKLIESNHGEFGRAAGVNFAEAYCRMNNETHAALPITEAAMKADVLTQHLAYSEIDLRGSYRLPDTSGSRHLGWYELQGPRKIACQQVVSYLRAGQGIRPDGGLQFHRSTILIQSQHIDDSGSEDQSSSTGRNRPETAICAGRGYAKNRQPQHHHRARDRSGLRRFPQAS